MLITNPEQNHTISGANGALFVHSCVFRTILTLLWSDWFQILHGATDHAVNVKIYLALPNSPEIAPHRLSKIHVILTEESLINRNQLLIDIIITTLFYNLLLLQLCFCIGCNKVIQNQ